MMKMGMRDWRAGSSAVIYLAEGEIDEYVTEDRRLLAFTGILGILSSHQ